MLNSGGTIDILAEFEAEDESSPLAELTFYLVDAHRPIDLANAYDPSRVVVFDDGQVRVRPTRVLAAVALCFRISIVTGQQPMACTRPSVARVSPSVCVCVCVCCVV
jgi:hypothetical protein